MRPLLVEVTLSYDARAKQESGHFAGDRESSPCVVLLVSAPSARSSSADGEDEEDEERKSRSTGCCRPSSQRREANEGESEQVTQKLAGTCIAVLPPPIPSARPPRRKALRSRSVRSRFQRGTRFTFAECSSSRPSTTTVDT